MTRMDRLHQNTLDDVQLSSSFRDGPSISTMSHSLLRLARLGTILALLAAALGSIWFLLADREPFHVYKGQAPPAAGTLATAPRVALVLGGGGPRGFAHVGVLKVLNNAGLKPDLIVGASMGAVVGALYAFRPEAQALERHLLESDPWAWWNDLTWTRHPWLKGEALELSLRKVLGDARLDTLAIPMIAVATDAQTGMPTAFSRGDVAAAVRASSAVPGMFKRVRIAGRDYLDGDISAPVPVGIARAAGARIVIAVDVMSHPSDMPVQMWDYPELSLPDYFRHAINLRELPQADLVLSPRLGYYIGTSRSERERAIREGEAAAQAMLPRLKALWRAP
jgi:NTE family protein